MKVVITIPAYNEEANLERVIREIKAIMDTTHYSYTILVVDDGSTDKTAQIAKQNKVLIISNKRNLGLAETFKKEMEECLKLKANIIVHTDADGQYPSKYIPTLIQKIEQGYDLVLGARFGKGDYSGSLINEIGNIIFAKVLSSLVGTKFTDTTTGFRAFTSEVAKLPLINSFTYTQEQLIRAGKAKMSITEIPIKTRRTRESRLFKNPLDYALKAWINIFRIYRDYQPIKFFGVIGAIFISIGFILGFWLSYLFLRYNRVGHYPTVIVAAILIIVGIQILLFGFLADMRHT